MIDPVQIILPGSLTGIAGFFLKDFLNRRASKEEPPTLQALHGAVGALQAIVARLEGVVSSIPTVQGDVVVLQQQMRTTRGDITRIDADLTDIRREAAEMNDRLRVVERRPQF